MFIKIKFVTTSIVTLFAVIYFLQLFATFHSLYMDNIKVA